MKARVFTGGKLSKTKGVSVAVAVIEGLDEEPLTVEAIQRPYLPTPSVVAMKALWLGVGFALSKGATELEVYSSSKNAIKATDGTGGANFETRLDAYLAAYVITWTRNLATADGSWSIAYRAAADMPEVVEHAAATLKAEAKREPNEPEPEPALALF